MSVSMYALPAAVAVKSTSRQQVESVFHW